jgi:hypothetical protein
MNASNVVPGQRVASGQKAVKGSCEQGLRNIQKELSDYGKIS